ncbi:Transmembrane protein 18 [Macleaya cordata]|uniref:Transmembrane protein 18 n=1 Tax=Macleaya cordata TaxID=56857 RepID=A0A200QPB6_MACCD|nr:Transmembrane protein 18 [Macleaya cordata]
MEDLKSAMNEHMELMSDLVEKFSGELRTGFQPAVDNFIGFFHAIDWKEPWLIGLMSFHVALLLTSLMSRKNINFQMFLFLMALAGVYFAEKINIFLGNNWKSFAGQNYFDPHGVFLSALWSGPLLFISIVILVNSLFSLCQLIVRWKKAELRHRARLARNKQD